MKNLRNRFERFCFQHRHKGIPNLMLYIVLGTGIVYFMNLINGGSVLTECLLFDKGKILQGQVWRLFTWLFTNTLRTNPLLNVLFLYFFYNLGRAVELTIGTFKFNLYYIAGVVLMDLFAMIFCPLGNVVIDYYLIPAEHFALLYSNMPYYLHLSLLLAFATNHPDKEIYIFFIIPMRAWVLALVYLVLVGIDVFNMCYPLNLMPHALFPLVGLLNYFLFFSADILNLLPLSWRAKFRKNKQATPKKTGTIPFSPSRQIKTEDSKALYTHKCTVCGRTDVSNPELEFRYCSRCQGYHCYCEDHISSHTHIE